VRPAVAQLYAAYTAPLAHSEAVRADNQQPRPGGKRAALVSVGALSQPRDLYAACTTVALGAMRCEHSRLLDGLCSALQLCRNQPQDQPQPCPAGRPEIFYSHLCLTLLRAACSARMKLAARLPITPPAALLPPLQLYTMAQEFC
jgi:hypothetical protein